MKLLLIQITVKHWWEIGFFKTVTATFGQLASRAATVADLISGYIKMLQTFSQTVSVCACDKQRRVDQMAQG